MPKRLVWIFGLLIGVAWMGEILFGNLGDTPVLGNFRTFHLHIYRTIGWSFIAGAVVLTGLAGFFAAYRIGGFGKAVFASVCSGLISGSVVLAGGMMMEVVFHSALRHSPSVLSEFTASGQTDLSLFMYGDALVGGIAHVLIGPALGITAGSLGATIGIVVRRVRITTESLSSSLRY
jgi:hypothetical protein